MRLPFLAPFLSACATVAAAQTQPEFDVASVRVVPQGADNSQSSMPTLDVAPGGTLRISSRRLDDIIRLAYTIGANQSVGPDWLTAQTSDPNDFMRFEVIAKVPSDAKNEEIPCPLAQLTGLWMDLWPDGRYSSPLRSIRRRSKLFALIADLQLELPAFIAHQHLAEFFPPNFLAIDNEQRYLAIVALIRPDHALYPPMIGDPLPELTISDVSEGQGAAGLVDQPTEQRQ